jgi:hypothetical protein
MPVVSYATILDSYILLNFYIILALGVIMFAFSLGCTASGNNPARQFGKQACNFVPGRWYGLDFIPAYNPVAETVLALLLVGCWVGVNAHYWHGVYERLLFNLNVVERVDIGWITTPKEGRQPGPKGYFYSERLIRFVEKPRPLTRQQRASNFGHRLLGRQPLYREPKLHDNGPSLPPIPGGPLVLPDGSLAPERPEEPKNIAEIMARRKVLENKSATAIQKMYRRHLAMAHAKSLLKTREAIEKPRRKKKGNARAYEI